jgi:hypothetical protein
VLICPSCGQENPDGFRFCGACASPLTEQLPRRREERKIVTVLFADLVGFTARAERLDPEDVRALLAPYHARLRVASGWGRAESKAAPTSSDLKCAGSGSATRMTSGVCVRS